MEISIFCEKDLVRISSEEYGISHNDQRNDITRKDILAKSSYQCVSNYDKDVKAYNNFVDNCFEWEVVDGEITELSGSYSDTEICSDWYTVTGDSCQLCMKVNEENRNIDQTEVMIVIINYIASQVKSTGIPYYGKTCAFITTTVLSDKRKEFIRKHFERHQISIDRFQTKMEYIKSNRIRQRRPLRNQTYKSIRLSVSDSGSFLEKHKKYEAFCSKQCEKYKNLFQETVHKKIEKSELTIACRITGSSYITLLSPADSAKTIKMYFPFAKDKNGPINIDLYVMDMAVKKYRFIGGTEILPPTNPQKLPPLIFLVDSYVYLGHQIIGFRFINTVTLSVKDFYYGDWQMFDIDKDQWDICEELLEVRENCLFSLVPIVDSVIFMNSEPLLKGRIYDLSGELCYEGIIQEYNTPLNQRYSHEFGTVIPGHFTGEYTDSYNVNLFINNDSVVDIVENDTFDWERVSPIAKSSSVVVYKSTGRNQLYVGTNMEKQDGYGIIITKGELHYVGNMRNGLYEGRGKVYHDKLLPENCYFEGDFHEGKIVGEIEMFSLDMGSRIFKGIYNEVTNTLRGRTYYCNCLSFDGTLRDWVPIEGIAYYLNGYRKYEGQFSTTHSGVAHGKGISYYPMQTEGRIQYLKGTNYGKDCGGTIEYEGDFQDGMREGIGTLYSKAGIPIYYGQFKKNRYHGKGRLCITPEFNVKTNEVIRDLSQEILKNWMFGKGIGNILYFDGEFVNGQPQKGIVVFRDWSHAEIEWYPDKNVFMGNEIMNIKALPFLKGPFFIKDWVISFPSLVKHLDNNSIKCSFYNNEKHCIYPNVIELVHREDKKVWEMASYNIIPKGNNWTWEYQKIQTNTSSPDFERIKKGMFVLVCVIV